MSPEKKRPAFKIISTLVLFCLIFNLIWFGLVWPQKSYAVLGVGDIVSDPGHTLLTWLDSVWDKIKDQIDKALHHVWAVAFKTALIHFYRTLATDVATWMASGGKGQQPMFITQGWGAYLTDVADSAAGEFIETFATGVSQKYPSLQGCDDTYYKCMQECNEIEETSGADKGKICQDVCTTSWNTCKQKVWRPTVGSTVYGGTTSGTGIIPFLCDPSSLAVKARITMGLAEMQRPRKPTCTVSSMLQNWDQTINDPNFLQRFQYYFDPYQSDLGIALTLQTNLLEEKARKQLEEQLKLTANQGVKDVTNPAGQILTPAWMVKQMGATPIENATKPQDITTGDMVADAIVTFANTLIGQLFQRWIKEGMVKGGKGGGGGSDYANLYNLEVGTPYAGTQAAQARFMKIFQPTFTPGGKYEVLQKLTSCPDYNNPGPDECVIAEKFRSAIENQMTVKEAIEQGYLDGGLTFGFNAQGYEPSYNQGYPYRSLIILRKYRVIPVGWELAAYYIGNFQGAQPRSYSLNDVITGYSDSNSPFYKLVDPTWVLKASEGYCRKEAPGEKINSLTIAPGVDTNNDGKYDQEGEQSPKISLSRADYCADDQSCIIENTDGTCKYYGYCSEEKRQWRFSGTACESKWASCQTFQSRQGETVSYLKNTLDFNDCNQENYGCSWYCQDYSPSDKYWVCQNAVNSYQKCANSAGCQVTDPATNKSCIIPYQGITCTIPACQTQGNLMTNGDFEQGTLTVLNNWTTSFYSPLTSEGFSKDGTQKHSGSNALRFYSVILGNNSAANNVLVKSNTTYDISGWVYNNLNQGVAGASVTNVLGVNSCGTLPANGSRTWQQFSCSISSDTGTNFLVSLNISGSPNGTIWFDQIEVKEQCSTEPIRLFMNSGAGLFSPINSIFFDHDVESCSQSAEGCSEFLRLQPNSGANLLPNGNFEEFSGNVDDGAADTAYNWQGQGEVVSDKYAGSFALKVPAAALVRGTAFAGTYIYGRHFVLSLYAKNCTAVDNYQILGGPTGASASKPFDGSTEWKRYTLDYLFPLTGYCSVSQQPCFFDSDCPGAEICEQLGKFVRAQINSQSGTCLIDNVQIEEGDSVTSYKDYGLVDKAYLKKAPAYYNCYDANPTNDFAECQNYTLSCAEEEVGCQRYTPTNNDPAVPGVVKNDDYCPAECVGYDTYKQKGTFFEIEPTTLDYFIPKGQKKCSAQAVGCAEFTNLDEVARGGEGREYYTYLRQCQKPDVATCATFYTWVGSEQSGYQLKSYGLRNTDANTNEPDTIPTSLDLGPCANIDDALTNPECKEFYNSATGAVSYVHYRTTVVCSDDCHPLRISQSTLNDCNLSGGAWDGSNCLYTAIPKESYSCSAAGNGCREYKGNTSYNKMTVVKDTFESGVNDWGGGTLSSESLTVGGHSLNVSGANISYNLFQPFGSLGCGDSLGCWHFENDFFDSSGNSNNGTPNGGVIFSDGVSGQATSFDGVDDYVDAGNAASLDITVGSYEAWFKAGSFPAPNSNSMIVGKYGVSMGFYLWLETTNGGITRIQASPSGSPGQIAIATTIPSLNVWYHVVGTFDGTNAKIYVNGVLENSVAATAATNNDNLNIGRENDNTRYFNGLIDEVKIYNRALSSTEIAQEYQSASKIHKDRTYLLSFWAKGQGNLTIKFTSADCALGQCFANGMITLTPDWHLYNLGPVYVTWDPNFPDGLEFSGFGANSFIDNIILTEVRDDIFVIKTTPWNVPTVCDEDQFGGSSPQFTLGCKAYKSSQGKLVNLKSFSNLCGEDKVGCEALIDTYNSTSPFEQVFNTNDKGEIVLPADASVYLVNNPKKSCRSTDKGCQMVGLPELDQKEKAADWEDIYLKNNPDKYNQILCKYSELGCEKYTTAKGDYYFKDPKNRTCEYKIKEGEKNYDWYKVDSGEECKTNDDSDLDPAVAANELGKVIPVGECLNSLSDGQACLKDEDCQSNSFPYASCSRWAGSCPSDQSSCTEFIDPVSTFAKDLLFNGNFSQDIDTNGADGWSTDNNVTGTQEVNLEANTLYTISALSNGPQNSADLQIKINNCPGIVSPDNSLNLAVTPPTPPRLEPLGASSPFEGSYSARFYTTSAVKCVIELPANFKTYLQEVNLKETGLYYNLAETVDQTSCNGLVNFEEGCVLFNKRDAASSSGYANLVYDADKSLVNLPPTTNCGNTDPGLCDTNVLLKVRPDRVCDKWLYCRSSIETRTAKGEIERNCLDVGLCDGVNERGECNSFPRFNLPSGNDNLTYSQATASGLQDLAGYVKVGYDWGAGNVLAGYRLFSNMPQVGGHSLIPNGNFEESGVSGTPFGWSYMDSNDACRVLRVVDNPADSQKEGLGQRAPEGAKFLRLAAGCSATSEYVDIAPNNINIASLWFNTLNLSEGSAQVVIEEYNSAGQLINTSAPPALQLVRGLGWTFLKTEFTPQGARLRIKLNSTSGVVEGRFYADLVRITPALNHQDNKQYTLSSCRGYPDDSAMSCDYKNESGVKKFGWWGYCLEYDRKPANPDQCLTWWPVDLIKGKGIEEGFGYDDKFPLYYCTDADVSAPDLSCGDIDQGENMIKYYSRPFVIFDNPADPNDDRISFTEGGEDDSTYQIALRNYDTGTWAGPVWFNDDGGSTRYININSVPEFNNIKRFDGIRIYCIDGDKANDICECNNIIIGSGIIYPPICLGLAQVVTPTGQNKYWSSRVFKGSGYTSSCNSGFPPVAGSICSYNSDASPFGSIVYPDPADDPSMWDSKTQNGIQPLYYEWPDNNQPRMGQFYDINNLQRLFAQSYGIWQWNGNNYVPASGLDWGPPTSACPGGVRPGFPNDYCAVPPRVENIKIDKNSGANLCLRNNSFINLTFNSVLDSQQQPLVAYEIDWGDDDTNSVSGLSMQARPNPDNPHSFHHLYGYWDLKAKDSALASVECAGSGGAVFTAICPADSPCCALQPKIQIKDNWGWCNEGTSINDCDGWDAYNGYIIVTEKRDSDCL